MQIALSRLGRTDEQLKRAVIEMDEDVFDPETLAKFVEMAPTEDEQREAERHAMREDVDPQYFGRAEKFMYTFVDLVDLSDRLRLWLFMQSFKESVSDKQAQICQLLKGCGALSESVSFRNVLSLLLAWGNLMNGGSHNGQAYGFEMDSLSLLPGIKTMDTSMNLMMFLYKTLYEKFPDDLAVVEELKAIKVCAVMDTELMDKSVMQIQSQFETVKTTLTRFEEDYVDVLPLEDRFIVHTKGWIKEHHKLLSKLLMLHKRTQTKCRKLGFVLILFSLSFSLCDWLLIDEMMHCEPALSSKRTELYLVGIWPITASSRCLQSAASSYPILVWSFASF